MRRFLLPTLLPLFLAGCADAPRPVDPSFPITFSQARAALAQMKSRPKPLERPLVIVGGFLDPNISAPLLKDEFHRVTGDDRILTLSVGFCGSFDECRREIIDLVQAKYPSPDPAWTSEVDVVGVSLGGLAARYAATPSHDPKRPRRLRIGRLFSISSPHAGATMAAKIGVTQFHNDMRPGSEFLRKLAQCDPLASYELYPYVRLADQIVGAQYAAPPGRWPLWVPSQSGWFNHIGAISDARILADIARRLRGEPPFSELPGSPLPAG